MGEWRYRSIILDLGTRWKWVVSFMPRPLNPRYPLDRVLGGHQSWSGRWGEEKNLTSFGNRTPAIQPVALQAAPFRALNKFAPLLKHHAMKIHAVAGDEWWPISLRKSQCLTHWIRDWSAAETVLDLATRKLRAPAEDWRLVGRPLDSHFTDWCIPSHTWIFMRS
jgi:hypothetical protein